jgi:exodeoxyribonuclease VII small subunit
MAAPEDRTCGDSPKVASEQPPDAASFEQTLSRLEEIVHLLEEGKIGLDEALARYEEGVGLLRRANELLASAERRISLLSGIDSEGNPIFRAMEDAATFSLERDAAGSFPPPSREKTSGRRSRRQVESDTPQDEF